MADATVSMLLNRLAPLIEKKVREEVGLFLNAKSEAQKLSVKLKKIHEVLEDAEQKGVTDRRVESWLHKLKVMAYEIDDVLDEWEMENIKQQLEESEDDSDSVESWSDSWEKKASSFLQSVCLCFKQTVHRRSIALDIRDINQRLDSIAEENEKEFNFIPNVGRDPRHFERGITTSYVNVSKVQGRDLDKKTLMSKLLAESSGLAQDGVRIVSIVGAGGMGKTTLAQLVFDGVKKQFENNIWICVSDPFDLVKIGKAILEVVDKDSSFGFSQPETLLQSIEKAILGQKFLLVLDDVWEKDESKWEPLILSLKNGAPGSRILVTTRKMEVAEKLDSTYVHLLEPLEDIYCWLVLSQIAFQKRKDSEREMLKETGKEIAKKCKGMPLAAKVIGGVLQSKRSLDEWESVLKSELWKLERVRTDIFPFLTLSYDELHPAVKRCFSYCAIFPKDEIINVEHMLIKFWMAQGFLSCSSGSAREMELLGRDYFEDLATRSFFQDFEKDDDDRIILCKMHDIVHDFAQFLTKNECLIVDKVDGVGAEIEVSSKDARHLHMILPEKHETACMTLFSTCNPDNLRSFFCRNAKISPSLFVHLKRVRSLILTWCGLRGIPEEIGNLIHLRLLDLAGNPITDLPENMCDLYNLQTLDIAFCNSLCGLPQGIHKLINLRNLSNNGTSSDFKFPPGLKKLTNLGTLDDFWATTRSGNKLRYLKDLNQLRGSLFIRIDDGIDEVEALNAGLKNKKFIRDLGLKCVNAVGLEIVEALQPHPNLLKLALYGLHLPKWITTLTNLRTFIFGELRLTNPGAGDVLSPIGKLPFLEEIFVLNLAMENVGHELFSVGFPKLKKLSFHGCQRWREWEDIVSDDEQEDDITTTSNILPSLQDLRLFGCVALQALPHRLLSKAKSLEFLKMINCRYLRSRYNQVIGQDWDKISHITCIEID